MTAEFVGRSIPDPGFADDDGTAPAALTVALATSDASAVVDALLVTRVLVPVIAVLGETEVDPHGGAREKQADMAVVTVRAPNGRLALPAFSSCSALSRWDSTARPVPVVGVLAARAAIDEGAEALVVDLGAEHRFAVDGPALRALADGRRFVRPLDDPDVLAAVTEAAWMAGFATHQVSMLPVSAGTDSDIAVALAVDPGISPEQAERMARSAATLMSDDVVLRARLVRGLDVRLVGPIPPV